MFLLLSLTNGKFILLLKFTTYIQFVTAENKFIILYVFKMELTYYAGVAFFFKLNILTRIMRTIFTQF
jgi:hypothetical protein